MPWKQVGDSSIFLLRSNQRTSDPQKNPLKWSAYVNYTMEEVSCIKTNNKKNSSSSGKSYCF